MPTLVCNVSALAVASLYYYWRNYRLAYEQREGVLRERVALMLWQMARTIA